ncbi:MAG: hypothetical protein LC789_17605 [Actinobacteria bacterium]|nr:hypothetical protein [Actinomycetota bacterium]MCA1720567.1 hypothetical protein [Actinomycetota bacterium]
MKQQGFSFGKFGGKAGLLLAGLGLIAIGLGVNGAAGQLTVLAQVPYLISGGLIGIALVVLGAAMLVVQGAREDRARLEAKLDLLTDAVLAGGGGPAAAAPAPQDASGLVIAGTASYHVPGCRLVDGREETSYLTPAEARANDLKPCRVCSPEDAVTNVTVR